MTGADVPADPGVIVEAAAGAVTMSNLGLGEQLARFALQHGGGVQAAIVLADAIGWQGRGREAEDLLAEWEPGHDDEPTVARWGCLRAANLFFGCGQLASARAVLATVRDRVRSAQMLSLATAMDVAFAFFSGDLPDAIALGTAALDPAMLAQAIPDAVVWTSLATAGALALSGRFSEVSAAAAAGERAAAQCESGPQRYALALAEVLASTAAGTLGAARQVCDRYAAMSEGAPADCAGPTIATALIGRVELARGRLDAACRSLQTSVFTMPDGLPPGWPMLVASWLAQAEAARGDVDAAAAALAKAEAAQGPQVNVFAPELELARAWLAAASGETSTAQQHAERAAQLARTGGMGAVELTALHTALRFGDRSCDARIQRLAGRLDGPLAQAIAVHSRGVAERDGARLIDAAERFERIGALVLACDAAAHAAREHARAGHRGGELEAATRAHWLASQCGATTPALRCATDPLPLTEREWEIANLVGSGLSNRKIADRLCLSVRTVDGHLYRMFAKLGVEDRDQLGKLVRFRPAT